MARHHRKNRAGLLFVAFGGGLLACIILPAKLIIVLLAVALVLCGCAN